MIAGTPGAVLVAGTQLNNLFGKISKIMPDGSIATVYGPTAFNFNPNVIVFDEPSASLAGREVDRLLAVMRSLRERGLGRMAR